MNSTTKSPDSDYRVLARKYRPGTFSELIGQDAMVQTLRNAMASGRLAHAFVLTGVRGVGKTTTARLIARSLNCSGRGEGGNIDPCGTCDNCVSIAESRHVDVLEMDAASRTGIDDIREIIESVRYAPIGSDYKIYIIDEVHMLSKNAFNALLKTLEEPPPHVKFIFATTEIRKIPLTVLSRCQRFDLRRVEPDVLIGHLKMIVEKEGVTVEEAALASIARAAEGSVRDALSLLDQALAHGGDKVSGDDIRTMLGLADRSQTLDLFGDLMAGKAAEALENLKGQYDMGADPAVVLQDLLALTHWVTRLKVVPGAGPDALTSSSEQKVGDLLAKALSMAQLSRTWQMLLKGAGEVRQASDQLAAAEMVLIRMAYAADMPTPVELVKKLESSGTATRSTAAPVAASAPEHRQDHGQYQGPGNIGSAEASPPSPPPTAAADSGGQVLALKADIGGEQMAEEPMPVSYEALVDMFGRHREGILEKHLSDDVHLVSYKPGTLSLNIGNKLPVDFAARLRACLEAWTGSQWQVIISSEEGEPTLRQQAEARRSDELEEARTNVVVRALLNAFEGAEVVDVRRLGTKGGTDKED